MTKEQLFNLKNQVIDSFVRHELGQELVMSDKLYDTKLAEIKAEDPNFDIYEFAPSYPDSDYVPHRSGMQDLEKVHIHDIRGKWNYEEGHHKLPKYDGSSVVIYYTNGKFTRVVSMRNKEAGIDQTEKFKSFVPQEVDPSISYIRCECLVDMRLDDNARGKANGLVNSKYLQDEINEKASLIAFTAHDLNGNQIPWDEFTKLSKYNKIRENGIPYFFRSLEVQDLGYEDGITMYQDSHVNFHFAIDGIVYYAEQFAWKYDYINSAITKIVDIEWNVTNKELLYPKIVIDPVDLGSAEVTRVSSNGVQNLVDNKLGIGATIEVARSGETIPQVISVVEGAEVQFPTCSCGHHYTINDLLGSALICTNEDCSERINARKDELKSWIEQDGEEVVKSTIHENPADMFMDYCNLSRININDRVLVDKKEINNKLEKYLKDNNFEDCRSYLGDVYNWTNLSWDEFWYKSKAVFIAFHDLIYV